ncbi:MAG: asparagine synthase (glutamine-hydrolyzing) [Chloroflexota bacterium]|nr:MAG: asparagine synthase (glutamine-hydrolyzing) [Chloroflexota bacterium]
MCGIAGILQLDGRHPDRGTIESMLDTMRHRGPDDAGTFFDGPLGLGARRLSIIDVAGGHQPVSTENGAVTVIQNGEIYNYAELRQGLAARGHAFRGGSDTEVIAHLYEEVGDACVDALRGMFAFALWDARRQRLLLTRDRLGVKPLYITRTAEFVAFASEIKALLPTGITRRVRPAALGRLLDLVYCPGTETMFDGVERLAPGFRAIVDASGCRIEPYWDIQPDQVAARASFGENQTRLRDLLDDSVRHHMVSDVPVGALLSGGIDSSIVVALAARHAGPRLKTYNVSFDVGELSAKYDERPFARLVADRYDTDHTEVRLSGADLARLFPAAVWHLDEPFGNPTALATYAVCEAARRDVKVVLSGDGGDELFAGYLRYPLDRAVELYQSIPTWVRRALVGPGLVMARRVGLTRANLAKLEAPPTVARYASWHRTMDARWAGRLLTPEWREMVGVGGIEAVFAEHLGRWPDRSFYERTMYADLKTWIPDQALFQADRMSMMASVELRVPLLDHRVVEFAAGVPFDQKARIWPLETKRIVKHAFRDELPDEVRRQRKMGFFAPAGKWLRTELRSMALDLLSSERLTRQGIFDARVVDEMLSAHLSGDAYYGHELWTLMAFQAWHDQFIDPATSPVAPATARAGSSVATAP